MSAHNLCLLCLHFSGKKGVKEAREQHMVLEPQWKRAPNWEVPFLNHNNGEGVAAHSIPRNTWKSRGITLQLNAGIGIQHKQNPKNTSSAVIQKCTANLS